MPRDPKYDILFEPIQLGPKTLKNRFYQVPHCIGAGSEKPGMQAYHRGMKAEGGWGACCTEYCSIHPESDDTSRVSARIWDEGDVRNLAAMCDRLHELGALAGIELWYWRTPRPVHGGKQPRDAARPIPDRLGLRAQHLPPRRRPGRHRHPPADVRRRGDPRARGGLRHHLRLRRPRLPAVPVPVAVLQPPHRQVRRLKFENRARFWRESLVQGPRGGRRRLRDRVSVRGRPPARADLDPGRRRRRPVCRVLRRSSSTSGDFTVGDIAEWAVRTPVPRASSRRTTRSRIPARSRPATTRSTRRSSASGRITNPGHDGRDHQLGAVRHHRRRARPSISDPFLPKKIEEGRLEDIRECIGCNQCISRWENGGPPMVCTQNATAGEEYRRGWQPEKFQPAANRDKGVLVVGAGPAGMDCAMILGKRDMSAVHLVDGAKEIGGCVNWISKLGHSDGKENSVPRHRSRPGRSGAGSPTTARSSSTSSQTWRSTPTPR